MVNAIHGVFKPRQCNALQGFPVPLSVLATLAKTPEAQLRTYATCDRDRTVNSNDTGIQLVRFGQNQSDINFSVSHNHSPYGYDQKYIKGLLAVRAQFLQNCATNPDRVAIAKELYRRSAAQMKQGLPSTANRVLGLSEMKGAIPDSAEVSAVQQRFKDLCTIGVLPKPAPPSHRRRMRSKLHVQRKRHVALRHSAAAGASAVHRTCQWRRNSYSNRASPFEAGCFIK